MEAQGIRSTGLLTLHELELVSEAVMLRLTDSDAEVARMSRMRELLWAASELTRALSLHTQHALVDCCGTHGTGDLAADTRTLHAALMRYSQLVRLVAAEYAPVIGERGMRSFERMATSTPRAEAV